MIWSSLRWLKPGGSRLEKGRSYLVVQDGGESARLFAAAEVLKARADLMLDMLPGGQELVAVEASTLVSELPSHRPLLVRHNGVVKGVLGGEVVVKRTQARRARRWKVASGGANAQAAAMDAVKEARPLFRRQGVALVLDVQPGTVDGDGQLVRDMVSRLLERSLSVLKHNGGGTSVHLRLAESDEGLLIEVQDRGTRIQRLDVEAMLSDDHSDDPAVLDLRELRDQLGQEYGGTMDVYETRTGTLFTVVIPSAGPSLSLVG